MAKRACVICDIALSYKEKEIKGNYHSSFPLQFIFKRRLLGVQTRIKASSNIAYRFESCSVRRSAHCIIPPILIIETQWTHQLRSLKTSSCVRSCKKYFNSKKNIFIQFNLLPDDSCTLQRNGELNKIIPETVKYYQILSVVREQPWVSDVNIEH